MDGRRHWFGSVMVLGACRILAYGRGNLSIVWMNILYILSKSHYLETNHAQFVERVKLHCDNSLLR